MGGPSTASPVEVFHASRRAPPRPAVQPEFTTGDELLEDDHLVYPVPGEPSSLLSGAMPAVAVNDAQLRLPKAGSQLCLSRVLGSRRPFYFEMLLSGVYCVALIDSGASHSFVSASFARENGVSFRVKSSRGKQADGSEFEVLGSLHNARIKLGPFRAKQSFYVANLSDFDVVLGMDFLVEHDPALSWRKRTMSLTQQGRPVTLHAQRSDSELPDVGSDKVELCTIQQYSRMQDVADSDVQCCYVTPASSAVLTGAGAEHPLISPVLQDFSDVLRTELPHGPPPTRRAADGTPIEHVIETASDVRAIKSKPFSYSRDEEAEVLRQLRALCSAGFASPSLSDWASPVLLVRKKPDPVTGERALRMCISYVKLNRVTLNRIAYRLPRVSDLLDKLTHATVFSKLDCLSGYHQVPVREEDQKKTAFCTPFGNYEFRVMPFGLCGAPSTFAYMMDEVFRAGCELAPGRKALFDDYVAV